MTYPNTRQNYATSTPFRTVATITKATSAIWIRRAQARDTGELMQGHSDSVPYILFKIHNREFACTIEWCSTSHAQQF